MYMPLYLVSPTILDVWEEQYDKQMFPESM